MEFSKFFFERCSLHDSKSGCGCTRAHFFSPLAVRLRLREPRRMFSCDSLRARCVEHIRKTERAKWSSLTMERLVRVDNRCSNGEDEDHVEYEIYVRRTTLYRTLEARRVRRRERPREEVSFVPLLYPTTPLLAHIIKHLWMMLSNRIVSCPPVPPLMGETPAGDSLIAVRKRLMDLASTRATRCVEEIRENNATSLSIKAEEEFRDLLKDVLGDPRHMRAVLSLRCTTGSICREKRVLLPGAAELLRSFNARHVNVKGGTNALSSSVLSVGARALAKHANRSTKRKWWGSSSGPEREKNRHANLLAKRMIHDATWINVHILPPSVPVVELRVAEGYGMRWELIFPNDSERSGTSVLACEVGPFRGFLEPQMPDGHEKGWVHD